MVDEFYETIEKLWSTQAKGILQEVTTENTSYSSKVSANQTKG